MSNSSYTVEAILKANDSGFSNAFKNAQKSVSGLSSMAAKTGSMFKSVLGANLVSSALTSGISVVTGNIQSLSREAMSASDGLQKFESTMSFGGYDGATIKQARADVKSYADKTVYDINDVANTTAQLASNGIKNYTKLTQAAGNLNAVAGGNANTFKTVGMVMTQTAGAGKLTTENWNQLADAIPGASGKLQEAMLKNGAYTGNFREAMENGQITAEEFNQAITDLGMTDVAKEAATSTATFEGAIGNLQATIVSGLLNVVDKAKPKLIELINSVTSFAGKIGDALGNLDIEGVISKVSSAISNVVSKVQTFWTAFSNTGAVTAFVGAIQSIAGALGHVWDSLTTSSSLTTLASVLGNVVKWLSQAATVAAKFISSLPAGAIQAIVGGLVGLVAGFKAFNFLKSFNPFNLFKKNAESGVSGATSVVRSASASVVSIIRSLGQSVATAASGIGQGIGAAFRGIGQGLAMVNPATIAALAVPILALGAAFALMGMQGQGIATILQGVGSVIVSVGTAIGTILNLALQGLAQALVIVAPVLPIITSAFAMLAPVIMAAGAAISMIISSFSSLAPVITALGTALSQVITAISLGIAQIAIAVTPIVAIISNVFVQVVAVVSQAIVQIVQALAPFIPAVTQMVTALAPVLSQIVQAFSNLVSQISPIIDSIANLFKTLGEQISNILDSAKGVITGFGDAVRNVLDGIAGIFDSMGNAALNAGKGVKEMAQGIKILVDLKLGDLAATLATTASGLGKMASHASGMSTLGTAMMQVGTGMTQFSTGATIALVALNQFGSVVTNLKTSLVQLPGMMTVAGAGFQTFTTQAISGVSGLSGVNAPIAAFKAQLMSLTPTILSATAGFAMFGARAMVITTSFAIIGGLISAFNARILSISVATAMAGASFGALAGSVGALGGSLSSISSGFARVGASASNSAAQMRSIISATQSVITAFNSMRAQVQSSMQAILTIVISIGNQMKAQGRIIGQQTSQNIAQGISSGVGTAAGAMNALMSAVRSAGMSGVGSMRAIGAYIGQGLASGMMSALGSVTAAANALVAQAERAARAKAKIHSPSRLFRDNVGIYIGQGVAVGIERSQKYVDNAMDSMFDKIDNFNAQVSDMMSSKAVYDFDGGRFSNDIEITYRNQDDAKLDTIREALDTIKTMASRDTVLNIDGREFARATGDDISDYQSRKQEVRNLVWGLGNNG
ncbi:Phage tail length tape-measure protein [Streptococcus macedonicus]|uniref:tape measure protein n=1 Tax=Streptococcus macedonicus TaxID=59310 RepID=UPI000812B176|nr:tape measure protein [Streptococcus macedonicus]SCA90016.1 Phage tail length tape-measure protein [Streptococcus macedonicus]